MNFDNSYFDKMVSQIYLTELQLNEANSFDTDVPFLDLFITSCIDSSKIYDKRGDFNCKIVNCPFLDGYVPHSHSYDEQSLQPIRFAKVRAITETN